MFTFDIGPLGFAILIIGSLLIGIGLRRQVSRPWEWILTAIGTFLGAWLASEWVVTRGIVAFDIDGVAVIAALAGGLFIGTAVALAVEYYVRHSGSSIGSGRSSGGSLTHQPR